MRTKVVISIDVDVARALSAAAGKAGCGHSALAEVILRRGLAELVPERVKAWAQAQKPAPEISQRLRESERRIRAALTDEFRGLPMLAKIAGCSSNIALRALHRLYDMNLVAAYLPPDIPRNAPEEIAERRQLWALPGTPEPVEARATMPEPASPRQAAVPMDPADDPFA